MVFLAPQAPSAILLQERDELLTRKEDTQQNTWTPPIDIIVPLSVNMTVQDIQRTLVQMHNSLPAGPFTSAASLNTLQSLAFCAIASELEQVVNNLENIGARIEQITGELQRLQYMEKK